MCNIIQAFNPAKNDAYKSKIYMVCILENLYNETRYVADNSCFSKVSFLSSKYTSFIALAICPGRHRNKRNAKRRPQVKKKGGGGEFLFTLEKELNEIPPDLRRSYCSGNESRLAMYSPPELKFSKPQVLKYTL